MSGRDLPDGSPYAEMDEAQVRAWYAYMKVQLRLRYEMNRQLRTDSDLSLADYDVLVALTSEPEGRMRMSALATRIGWERSRASHQAKRMQARGLVSVVPDPEDRRASVVGLTAEGWKVLRAATPEHVALVREMFLAPLSPEDLQTLSSIMERVYDNVIAHGTLPRPQDHP